MEAHVVVRADELKKVEAIKDKLKLVLKNKFKITHSTLEFEHHIDTSCDEKWPNWLHKCYIFFSIYYKSFFTKYFKLGKYWGGKYYSEKIPSKKDASNSQQSGL